MAKWIIGALVGVVVIICAFLLLDPNSGIIKTSSMQEEDTTKINVEIDGAVVNPGIYTLESEATLEDLVTAAGGLLSSADETCFNLTTNITNYDMFYIPFESGYAEECIPVTQDKVNINTANVDEIASINGLSETLANKIVEYREINGSFNTLEEIMNVTGIGIKTYEKVRDYITLK